MLPARPPERKNFVDEGLSPENCRSGTSADLEKSLTQRNKKFAKKKGRIRRDRICFGSTNCLSGARLPSLLGDLEPPTALSPMLSLTGALGNQQAPDKVYLPYSGLFLLAIVRWYALLSTGYYAVCIFIFWLRALLHASPLNRAQSCE